MKHHAQGPRAPSFVVAIIALFFCFDACAPVRREGVASLKAEGVTLPAEDALDAKLDAQWKRFDQARAFALNRVVTQGGLVKRDEWEAMLAPPADQPWTDDDLKSLATRQDALVAKSLTVARAASALDLTRVKSLHRSNDFCRDLPKGGLLHVHPWGTLDRPTVATILTKVNPTIDFAKLQALLSSPGGTGTIYPAEHEALHAVQTHAGALAVPYLSLAAADQKVIEDLYFLPPGKHQFDRFTGTFSAISALTFGGSFDAEPLMFASFLERAKAHHVRYVEISRTLVPKPQWFAGLNAWAAQEEADHGVVVRLLASFARNKDAEFTRGKAQQLLGFPASETLNGINFLADESNNPALEQGQTLYLPVLGAVQAGKSKLHRTIHAGELGDLRNVRDGLIMGAERLGHGVLLAKDPVTLEYARIHHVPVEVNLVSNVRLSVVPSIEEHPFLRYLRLGLPVSLSTDDEGIFESTIDDDCQLAIDHSDVTYSELKQMSYNSIATSFAEDATKTALKAALDQDFSQFEAVWTPTVGAAAPASSL